MTPSSRFVDQSIAQINRLNTGILLAITAGGLLLSSPGRSDGDPSWTVFWGLAIGNSLAASGSGIVDELHRLPRLLDRRYPSVDRRPHVKPDITGWIIGGSILLSHNFFGSDMPSRLEWFAAIGAWIIVSWAGMISRASEEISEIVKCAENLPLAK